MGLRSYELLQPGFCEPQVPSKGPQGNPESLRNLVLCHSAEKLQLDDLGLTLVERGKAGERLVESHQVGGPLAASHLRFLDRNPFGSGSLLGIPCTGVVHQNLAHQMSRKAEKMGTAFPLRLLLVHESEIGFMDQRRWLERMIRALAAHVGVRKPP